MVKTPIDVSEAWKNNIPMGYDVENDPDGWCVHEKICTFLTSINSQKSLISATLSNNDIKRYAFVWQFIYLLETKRIRGLSDVKQIVCNNVNKIDDEIVKYYFTFAQSKERSKDPDLAPSGLFFDSSEDLDLEDFLWKIVDDAEKMDEDFVLSQAYTEAELPYKETNKKGATNRRIKVSVIIGTIFFILVLIYML